MERYSSRTSNLYEDFFIKKMSSDVVQYDRIAGYFSSTILDIAKESFESIDGCIRIICNSDLSASDIKIARQAKTDSNEDSLLVTETDLKMKREWNKNRHTVYETINKNEKFNTLYNFLKSGKIQIRVIPKEVVFVHSKVGILKYKNGSHLVFCGSVNETRNAWENNYEALWCDDSIDSLKWAEADFEYYWNQGIPLSDYIINDIKRIVDEEIISIEDWKHSSDISPYPILKNTPLYLEQNGLMDHQIDFVQFAFYRHYTRASFGDGARLILADEVGLGKTFQLGAFAKLLSIYGDKPILIIAPKTLCFQWQQELYESLHLHSAVWSGNKWLCEDESLWHENIHGYKKQSYNSEFLNCPRKVAIISQGLITGSTKGEELLGFNYEAILVDEAHKATGGKFTGNSKATKLTKFLLRISKKTKSIILASATPIQLDKSELLDSLDILAEGSDSVLGDLKSRWRITNKQGVEKTFKILSGKTLYECNNYDTWQNYLDWLKNPLLPKDEDTSLISPIREEFSLKDNDFILPQKYVNDIINITNQHSFNRISFFAKQYLTKEFMAKHNPISHHVIRRSRDKLEEAGILTKINVELYDDKIGFESIDVRPNIKQVQELAESFSDSIHKRCKKKGAGFTKTLLLRRLNSSLIACYNTVDRMLSKNFSPDYIYDETDDDILCDYKGLFENLTEQEIRYLTEIKDILSMEKHNDPKYLRIKKVLTDFSWLESGCIMFSQYYDTANYVFEHLIEDFPKETIALYSGASKSSLYMNGKIYTNYNRDEIKRLVELRKIRLFVGTDAASEGLNLQYLQNLINIDIPYNPTRLEQRKGRIQRPGQINDCINIYNLRYKDSIDDRVKSLLIERFQDISLVFGKIPDVISDIWIDTALKLNEDRERKIKDSLEATIKNKFDIAEREVNTECKKIWESNVSTIENHEIDNIQKTSWEDMLTKN